MNTTTQTYPKFDGSQGYSSHLRNEDFRIYVNTPYQQAQIATLAAKALRFEADVFDLQRALIDSDNFGVAYQLAEAFNNRFEAPIDVCLCRLSNIHNIQLRTF